MDVGTLGASHGWDSATGGGACQPSGAVQLCPHELQNGYSVYANDCNDTNPAITPGTFTCVGGQFPTQVTICTSNGTWMSAACSAQQACITQPTGVGICR